MCGSQSALNVRALKQYGRISARVCVYVCDNSANKRDNKDTVTTREVTDLL